MFYVFVSNFFKPSPLASETTGNKPQHAPAVAKEVKELKGRLFRLGLAIANLGILVAVSGAGNKWA